MDNDKQIAYLAGDLSAPIDPAERSELDAVRAVLNDPAVWVEPHPDLQERIVGAIAAAGNAQRVQPSNDLARTATPVDTAGVTHRRSRLIRFTILGVAAAVVLAVGLAIGLNDNGSRSVEYAASPSSYPTLTVTRQRANGDQSSSGQVALLGTTHRVN
ncbi:MAG TPA: hypothetical protein VGL39_01925 [Jatrophihabitantaceae bacterium]|jgi:hypothetical protein